MLNYLQRWIDQLRWQRRKPFQKLAEILLDHLDGILDYYRTKIPLGVVEDVNGTAKLLLRRGRGYKNLRHLLLKAQRMAHGGDQDRIRGRHESGAARAEFSRSNTSPLRGERLTAAQLSGFHVLFPNPTIDRA